MPGPKKRQLIRCKRCRERARKLARKNKKDYELKNKEKISKRKRQYYLANREKLLKKSNEYYKKNWLKVKLKKLGIAEDEGRNFPENP